MRMFVIGAILAFAGHTRADPDARMENLMGKAFMFPAAPPQRSSHMSVHVGRPVAHGDRAPTANFPVSNPERSIAQLRGEIFKLQKTNDRMKAELKGFRSQIAIMKVPQEKAVPAAAQNWRNLRNGLGYVIGPAFLLSVIFNFFAKSSHRAPVVSMSPLDGAELQPSEATACPLFSSSGRLRTVGGVMSDGEGLRRSEAVHSLEPADASNYQPSLQFTFSTSTATALLLHGAPRHANAIRMIATDDEAAAYNAWMERNASGDVGPTTSAADQAKAQRLKTSGKASAGEGVSAEALEGLQACQVESGTYKYVQVHVIASDGSEKVVVRSGPGDYHADVADPLCTSLSRKGLNHRIPGGGRIRRDDAKKEIEIYGHSIGFGMPDHSISARVCKDAFPEYTVTHRDTGY